MCDIVNLRQARKQAARVKKRAEGDENAAKSGVSKADRLLATTKTAAAKSFLDRHKLEHDDE